MGQRQRRVYTRDDFLRWEAEQPERWEFLDGIVRMMAGGSVDHNRIAGRLYRLLAPVAERRGCEAFQQNQKLAPEADDSVVYPDVFVTCRPLQGAWQTVPAATLVVEVTSESTRDDDYSWKWHMYRDMPELRHYVLVETKKRLIAHYWRAADGADDWRHEIVSGNDGLLRISALDAELPLAEVYAGTSVP